VKRQRVVAAIEKSLRYFGVDSNRAKVRVHVSLPVVTAAECRKLMREWGVKYASIEPPPRDGGQIVEFLFKTFDRSDTLYHAAFLVAWFRRVKRRGARVRLLNAAALPMHALRSIWRARRLRERQAKKSAR
jgi:hypothetical protein